MAQRWKAFKGKILLELDDYFLYQIDIKIYNLHSSMISMNPVRRIKESECTNTMGH